MALCVPACDTAPHTPRASATTRRRCSTSPSSPPRRTSCRGPCRPGQPDLARGVWDPRPMPTYRIRCTLSPQPRPPSIAAAVASLRGEQSLDAETYVEALDCGISPQSSMDCRKSGHACRVDVADLLRCSAELLEISSWSAARALRKSRRCPLEHPASSE